MNLCFPLFITHTSLCPSIYRSHISIELSTYHVLVHRLKPSHRLPPTAKSNMPPGRPATCFEKDPSAPLGSMENPLPYANPRSSSTFMHQSQNRTRSQASSHDRVQAALNTLYEELTTAQLEELAVNTLRAARGSEEHRRTPASSTQVPPNSPRSTPPARHVHFTPSPYTFFASPPRPASSSPTCYESLEYGSDFRYVSPTSTSGSGVPARRSSGERRSTGSDGRSSAGSSHEPAGRNTMQSTMSSGPRSYSAYDANVPPAPSLPLRQRSRSITPPSPPQYAHGRRQHQQCHEHQYHSQNAGSARTQPNICQVQHDPERGRPRHRSPARRSSPSSLKVEPSISSALSSSRSNRRVSPSPPRRGRTIIVNGRTVILIRSLTDSFYIPKEVYERTSDYYTCEIPASPRSSSRSSGSTGESEDWEREEALRQERRGPKARERAREIGGWAKEPRARAGDGEGRAGESEPLAGTSERREKERAERERRPRKPSSPRRESSAQKVRDSSAGRGRNLEDAHLTNVGRARELENAYLAGAEGGEPRAGRRVPSNTSTKRDDEGEGGSSKSGERRERRPAESRGYGRWARREWEEPVDDLCEMCGGYAVWEAAGFVVCDRCMEGDREVWMANGWLLDV